MRPRIWFGIGFLLVFLGMLFFVKMHVMHPSGNGVVECPLWRYYGSELSKQVTPQNLGPASNNGSAFGETLLIHIILSVLGGGVFAGARVLVCKSLGKKTVAPRHGSAKGGLP
jgi:hypothetical protein